MEDMFGGALPSDEEEDLSDTEVEYRTVTSDAPHGSSCSATPSASATTAGSLKRTGAMIRTHTNVPAIGPNVGSQGAKFKSKDEIGKMLVDQFETHFAMTRERASQLDQRAAKRQKLDDDRFALEKARAEREQLAYEQEARHKDRLHQLALSERFFAFMERDPAHADPDAAGELVFGHEDWLQKRPVMLAMLGKTSHGAGV